MKRIFSILLCMVLCLACTMLPAFAASEGGEDTGADVIPVTATTPDVFEKDYAETPLSQLIHDLFGTYTPRTQTVTVYAADGTYTTYSEVIPGLAGLDWNWILCAVLFVVTMFCVLKMIGGLLKWN